MFGEAFRGSIKLRNGFQVSLDQWIILPYTLSVPEGFCLRHPLNLSSIVSQYKPRECGQASSQNWGLAAVNPSSSGCLASLSGSHRWVHAVGASQTVRGTLHTVIQKKPSTPRAQRGSAGQWARDGASGTSGGAGHTSALFSAESSILRHVKHVGGDG